MKEEKIVYYSIIKKSNIKVSKSETKRARILLKNMLNYLNLSIPKIYIDSNGKPYFKDSNIFFNYSHSKNYIACAVSYYEVGIDIEETSRIINDGVAKKYLGGEKNNKKRIEKWVKKEAYSKLKGLGLQINFQNINLENIKVDNFFISEDNYMCSIYCDSDNIIFKKINTI